MYLNEGEIDMEKARYTTDIHVRQRMADHHHATTTTTTHTHINFREPIVFFLTKYNQGNLEGTCMYHRTLLINDYLCTVDVLLLVM